MPPLLAVIAIAGVAGCGSSSSKGDGGSDGATTAAPATLAEACTRLHDAVAQRLVRCNGGSLADWTAYEETLESCTTYERHAGEGLVEYRPAGFAACLDELAKPCDNPSTNFCPYEVLFGKLAEGQPCEDTEVCGPNAACINLTANACGDVCVRLGVENEACGIYCGSSTPCLEGGLCAFGTSCNASAVCVKSQQLGEPCGGPQQLGCLFTLVCNADPAVAGSSGTCVARQTGGPCHIDTDCFNLEFCSSGLCTPRRPLGAACADAPASCAAWSVCDTSTQVCVAAGQIGQPCSAFPGAPDGIICSRGTCDGTTCVPIASLGQSCTSSPCAQGSTCDPSSSNTCTACPR